LQKNNFLLPDYTVHPFIFQVVALKVKRDGDWKTWTYERYLREVQLVARGFIHIGLTRHHSVGIMGNNTPEWVISDLAAIFAG
jgi:long-subunit acyl-CoA synthetase (AMP-forming)